MPAEHGAARPATVTVVICCFTEERWNDILADLGSLRRQTAPPHEILVVVDHCPSLLENLLAELDSETVLANAFERGLSGGRNTGIRAATGEIVAFLDDDAVADTEWVSRLAREYADPRVIAVGGRTEPSWEGPEPSWFPEEFGWVVGFSYHGLPTSRATVRNVFGGNMSIRRDMVAELGGFRDGIGRAAGRPLGCEETELCIRAGQRYAASCIVYQPDAVIWHRVPAQRATFRYFRSRCYAEGLSKAAVARFTGRERALATERTYVTTTLRLAVLAGLKAGVLHADGAALRRTCAVLAGLAATCWGYGVGAVTIHTRTALRDPADAADSHSPVPLGQ
jgi:GT2 family glycosyltransferase